jgi:hypothetical protein
MAGEKDAPRPVLHHNVVPLRQAWGVDKDKDVTPAGQRDAPGGEVVRGSWATALASEAHQLGDTLLDAAALYGAKQAVDKVVDKIRKPPAPPPGPGDSQGGQE